MHKPGFILKALSSTTETSLYHAAAEIRNVHLPNPTAWDIFLSETLIYLLVKVLQNNNTLRSSEFSLVQFQVNRQSMTYT